MPVSPSHPPLRLAQHVRVCRLGDQMIFLDLLRSRYIGLGGPRLASLEAALAGRPAVAATSEVPADRVFLDDCARRLRSQQLLSETTATDMQKTSTALPEPIRSLTTDDEDSAAKTDLHRLARLWRATLAVRGWVRWRSLAGIADGIAALRARDSSRSGPVDADAMRAEVASYMHLRPFALTTHDRCLHDSLTLIHYLGGQGMFPHWVIGVRTHPFVAHSWVQIGDAVLNDLPERVRRYQPILVV